MDILTQLAAFVITILVLVSVHEAGHFFVAKLLGIKVVRFSIGFGKPIVTFHDRNGTEYVIAMIPLGGYVRLLDEREGKVPEADKPSAFNRQPIWVRTLVVLAGPFINLLFAIFAFGLMYLNGIDTARPLIGAVNPNSIAAKAGLQSGDEITSVDGRPTPSLPKVAMGIIERMGETTPMLVTAKNPTTKKVTQHELNLKQWSVDELNPDPFKSLGITPARPALPAVIEVVEQGSPAAGAGLKPHDRVVSVNAIPLKDWYDFVEYIQLHPGQKITLSLQRENQPVIIKTVIGKKFGLRLKPTGYLGVRPISVTPPPALVLHRQYTFGVAFKTAAQDTWQYLKFNGTVMKKLLMGEISVSTLGGPIAIFASADDAFRQGVSVFLGFLALISVMLAFVNLLPIPGLDGGHLLNYLIELIIQRPLSIHYEIASIRIGMVILLLMMVLATYNDILRLFFDS
jgi:regulator of sigma E protease